MQPPTLKVKLTRNVPMPTRGYKGDAGWDLAVPTDIVIPNGQHVTVAMGVAVDFPEGYCGVLFERSSMAKNGLMLFGRLIDNGYHGEIHCIIFNCTPYVAEIPRGARIAQLVPVVFRPSLEMELQPVVEFERTTDRGEKRMGSTDAGA
jgi:deoxyuridine 5'-triphosphate nucleotidohydrolase